MGDSYMHNILTIGSSDIFNVYNPAAVRPVITLESKVEVLDGDGTDEKPYIVGPLVTRNASQIVE